jgi:non-specific serine/threonine protein kinase
LDGQRAAELTAALEALADKSLVRLLPDQEQGPRFGMLETIREFGVDALVAAGEDAAIRARHAAYFRLLVERADEMLTTADGEHWLGLLDTEHDNIYAALTWAAEQPDPDVLLRFLQPMGHYWYLRSYVGEARLWLGRALERGPAASPELRGDALYAASMMARGQSDFAAALRLGEEALGLARELGDSLRMLKALSILGGTAQFVGNHTLAAERLQEGLALARHRNEAGRVAAFLNLLGDVARAQGDDKRAYTLVSEGLALKQEMGDAEGAAWCLGSLGGYRP